LLPPRVASHVPTVDNADCGIGFQAIPDGARH
jgi:hypothetical protein